MSSLHELDKWFQPDSDQSNFSPSLVLIEIIQFCRSSEASEPGAMLQFLEMMMPSHEDPQIVRGRLQLGSVDHEAYQLTTKSPQRVYYYQPAANSPKWRLV